MRIRVVVDEPDSRTVGSTLNLTRCPGCLSWVQDGDLAAHQAWEATLVTKPPTPPVKTSRKESS